ncbi:MAG: hypothetical protein H7Z72_26135 [Bacteroidetes bacterium]|nr:hypothetical protein [Fibrella sp.]
MRSWLVGLGLVLCGWSALGQLPTREGLTGTWIGVHTEFAKGLYCPLPAYLDLQSNGTYRFGLIDESAPARTTTWAIAGDTLRLFDLFYTPELVTLLADTLRLGVAYPMTFRRFQDIPVDSATVQKALVNHVWQTDSLTVHFHDSGRVCLENRTTGQRTVHYWRLSRRGQSVFVVMQGSQHKTGGAYKSLWQLVALPETQGVTAATQFQATHWN